MRRVTVVLGLLLAMVLAGPAAAQAATVLGAGTDATGDAPAGSADITAVGVRYDDAGTLVGAATFAGAPTADADGLLLVFLGTVDGTSCRGSTAIGGPLVAASPTPEWGEADASGTFQTLGSATRTADGAQVRFTATGSGVGGRSFDCAYAALTTPDGQTVQDAVGGFALDPEVPPTDPPPTTTTQPTTSTPPATTQEAPPATPTQASPPPTTTQAAPAPAPVATPAPTPAVSPVAAATAAAKAIKRTGAHLELVLPTTKAGKRGVTRALRITVRNRGTKTAVRPVLRLTPPAGVTLRPRTVKLGSIAKGKRRTVTVRLRVGTKAKATASIRVAVRTRTKGTARTASAKLGLPVKQPAGSKTTPSPTAGGGGTATTPGSAPAPAPAATSLAGRYYFWLNVDVTLGQSEDAVYFVDGQWAYRGVPEGGLPTCTSRTAGTDERGDPTPGCVPYTFDPARNALTLDGQPVPISPALDLLTIGDHEYPYKPIVPAGTKLDVDLKSIRQTGIAPFNATVSTLYLTLRSSGEFALSSETIGSFGTPGAAGSGNFAASHPDQAGTWTIPADGQLVLTYADGHVDRWTLAVDRDPKTGGVDPATNGLLLDDRFFFKDDGD